MVGLCTTIMRLARLLRSAIVVKPATILRFHRGLDGAPPDEQSGINIRKVARLDEYRWEERCRGLYRLPAAA